MLIIRKSISPLTYILTLLVDYETYEKTICHLEIIVESKEVTNMILLHACKDHIEIQKASVQLQDNTSYPLKFEYQENQRLRLTSEEDLPSDTTFSVHIDFIGKVNNEMLGFYTSKLASSTPTKDDPYPLSSTQMLSTQFEATDARRAMPCFDEPSLKAEFELTILYPTVLKHRLSFLSNMPVERRSNIPDLRSLPSVYTNESTMQASSFFASVLRGSSEKHRLSSVSFERSPRMSTYLYAFAISPLDVYSETDSSMANPFFTISAYTPPGLSSQAIFSVKVAHSAIAFFENFFKVAFPLPKLDLLAVPDFAAGAMENWGLITFREICMLIDKHTATQVKRYAAIVVSHEVGHMWFGNLVTMNWWNDLWLNEGFATFVEYEAASRALSDERIREDLLEDSKAALNDDVLLCAEAICQSIEKDSDIRQAFDSMRYNKGGSVLRMLSNWVGLENFGEALGAYLDKYKFKNAASLQLFETLEERLEKPIVKMMTSFVDTPGVPGVRVSIDKADKKTIRLTQEDYKLLSASEGSKSARKWTLPIFLKVHFENGEFLNKVVFFEKDQQHLTETFEHGVAAVILNEEEKGYYICEYSDEDLRNLFEVLSAQINSEGLSRHTENSLIKVLFDSFLQHKRGLVSFEALENLLTLFRGSSNHRVVGLVHSIFRYRYLFDKAAKGSLRSVLENFTEANKHVRRLLGTSKASSETPVEQPSNEPIFELKVNMEKEYSSLFKSSVLSALHFSLTDEDEKAAVLRTLLKGSESFDEKLANRLLQKETSSFSEAELKFLLGVDGNNRRTIYSLLADRNETLEGLFALFERTESSEIKRDILFACSSAEGAEKVKSVLEFSRKDAVKLQDKFIVFVVAIQNNEDRDRVLEWIDENKEYFLGLYKEGFLANRIVGAMAVFAEDRYKEKVVEIFGSNENVSTEVKRVLEKIEINKEYQKRL